MDANGRKKIISDGTEVTYLVEEAKRGNKKAFDVLHGLYHDRILNYVSRMVHDPIEAEDIAQEAFVKAHRNLPSFRGASTFQTWLYRIASNLTIDSIRRRRRRENTVSLDAPLDTDEGSMQREQEDKHENGPARSLEVSELQRAVHLAIQMLTPKLRCVIVLYELQGLTYEEIAEILGCPLGTVKSRIFNARIELRQRLLSVLDIEERGGSQIEKRRLMQLVGRMESLRSKVLFNVRRQMANQDFAGEEAEDIVQEAYVKAYTKLDDYHESGYMLAWLLKIAINTLINFRRKADRKPVIFELQLADKTGTLTVAPIEDQADPDGPPGTKLLMDSEIEHVLSVLPDEFRETVFWRIHGYEYREIAELQGIPVGTVRSRLFRGTALLRRHYATEQEAEPTREATELALSPFDMIQELRKQVRGWLENATWNQGYREDIDIDALIVETYRRADTWVILFKDQGGIKDWFRSLAEYVAKLAIDEIKRQARLQEMDPESAEQASRGAKSPADSSQSIDDLIATHSDPSALLAILPDNLRQIYALKVICNSSNSQIISALGGSQSTIRSGLSEARKILKTAIEAEEAKQKGDTSENDTGQIGAETTSKTKGRAPEIIGSQLAREAGNLPLAAMGDETLYQNLVRTCVAGTDDDLVAFMDKFEASELEKMIKRFVFHPRSEAELGKMTKIDPTQLVSEIIGCAWLEIELGDVIVYDLEERLCREGEKSKKTLEQLYHLLGCADATDFAGRLDFDKIPDSTSEGVAQKPPQQTTEGEGSVEVTMPPTKRNGDRLVSELGDLIDLLRTQPESGMTIEEFEEDLPSQDRLKLFDIIKVEDEDDFDEWCDKWDQNWVPFDPRQAKAETTASAGVDDELPGTGPFTEIAQFAGKKLSNADLLRLEETPASLWGLNSERTFAGLAYGVYSKAVNEGGKGLVALEEKLLNGSKLRGKLPSNLDKDELFKMVNHERDRRKAAKAAAEKAEKAASQSGVEPAVVANHKPATGQSGIVTAATSGTNSSSGGSKVATKNGMSWQAEASDFPGAKPNEKLCDVFMRRWTALNDCDDKTARKEAKEKLYADLKAFSPEGMSGVDISRLAVIAGDLRRRGGGRDENDAGSKGAQASTTKAEEGTAEMSNWFAGNKITGATNWSRMYGSPARLVVEGKEGSLIDLLRAKYEAAGKGNGTKALIEFYEENRDRLPTNIDGAGLVRAVQSAISRANKAGGGQKPPTKKATAKKAAPKKAAVKAVPMNEEEQIALWQLPAAEQIELVEGDGWPEIAEGVVLGDYLAVVKAEGIGPDDIFRVIDRIAGSRLPKDVFDAFFAQLEPASQVSEDQERSAREVKVARQALVNECCRKSVGDYSIASYLPEGWPAPDTDWSVTAYMRQLKGAEIGSDEVIAFIADKIGLADHAVEVAELYETLEPIVPEPVAPPVAASSTPPTALAPAEPPGRSLSYKPLGTSESKPMSEIEKAIEMLMVNSAMKEDSEWLFQFLAERTDVLSDLSAFMAKRMAEKLAPMVATDEQIAALDRRMGEYIRRFIVSPQATEGESST